jgi:hypothetical protein
MDDISLKIEALEKAVLELRDELEKADVNAGNDTPASTPPINKKETYSHDTNGQWAIKSDSDSPKRMLLNSARTQVAMARAKKQNGMQPEEYKHHLDAAKQTLLHAKNLHTLQTDQTKTMDRKAACDEVAKMSNYKGYTEEDNAKRKAGNIADTDIKAMPRVKRWGGSGVSAAGTEAKKMKRLSSKQPVKTLGPDSPEAQAINAANKNK